VLSKLELRDLRFTEAGGLIVGVQPTIENIGKFPATNVRIEYELVDLPRQPATELTALRKRMVAAGPDYPGEVVFPGKLKTPTAFFVVKLDSLSAPNSGNGSGKVQLFLVGCISYTFALSDKLHETPFSGYVWGSPIGAIPIGVNQSQVVYDSELGMLSSQRPT
jgi:hypothetical protein